MITKEIHDLLDEMIDKLQEAGVDVSYFPEEAQKVIWDYAEIIRSKQS